MYLSGTKNSDAAAGTAREPAERGWRALRGVPRNVTMLGWVSLLTDVSSEMITAVIGYYLLYDLHQSTTAVGFLDGLYSGIPALLAIPAAYLADRYQRRKALAGVGYGLSAVTKLGFPIVGASFGGLVAIQSSDRFGKGLRTAPRDALISLSTPDASQGRAFGVHRMMDTVGACAGPALAAIALAQATAYRAFDAVFFISFCVAAIGLVVLFLFVTDHREPMRERRVASIAAGLRMLRERWFRRVVLCAMLLAVVWVSDTFVYLTISHRLDLSASQYAMLALGTTGAYLLLAIPFGALSDRVGRWRVFFLGHLALLAVYLLLAGPLTGAWLVLLTLPLHGAFYAATDGVLMAFAGPQLPKALRTSGLAVLQTGRAVAAFGSSMAFGVAWKYTDPRNVMLWFAGALVVVLLLVAWMLPIGQSNEARADD